MKLYLLHRPTYEEVNNEYVYSFIDDIVIRTDTEGNIKEVSMMKSESTEETLLSVQWLIRGLEPVITLEEVNEIIFPNNASQYYQVGDFNVGINKAANGFSFKAVPY